MYRAARLLDMDERPPRTRHEILQSPIAHMVANLFHQPPDSASIDQAAAAITEIVRRLKRQKDEPGRAFQTLPRPRKVEMPYASVGSPLREME